MRWVVRLALVALAFLGLQWLTYNVPDAFGWILFACLVLLYFLPTTVALNAMNRQTLAIFVLNLFLGWTLIGWVVALVWASVVPRETRRG